MTASVLTAPGVEVTALEAVALVVVGTPKVVTAALGPAPAHVERAALEPVMPRVQLETMALAPALARAESAASAPARPKG